MFGAGEMFRELDILFFIDEIDSDIALAELERSFHGIGQACERGFLFFFITLLSNHKTVHNRFDGVLFIAIELDLIIQ